MTSCILVGFISGFAQCLQWRLAQHAAQPEPAAGERAQHAGSGAGQPQRCAKTPRKMEYVMGQRPRNRAGAAGREQAGHRAQQRKFDPLRMRQLRTRGAQRAQQRRLARTFILLTE